MTVSTTEDQALFPTNGGSCPTPWSSTHHRYTESSPYNAALCEWGTNSS